MKKLYAMLMGVALAAGFAASAQAAEQEITGQLGCAHCAFHSGKSCAVGVKTADGKVYIVTNADKALFKAREEKEGKTVVVKGEVSGNEIKASKTEIKD